MYGTGTQMGMNIGVTLIIYDFSTQADRQTLVDAFTKGQNQGLVNALQKMPAVGRMCHHGHRWFRRSIHSHDPHAHWPQNSFRYESPDSDG